MSALLWCLGIYLASAWILIRVVKYGGGEIKEDDLSFIIIPGFNTLIVLFGACVTVVEWFQEKGNLNWLKNSWKCSKQAFIRLLNKL